MSSFLAPTLNLSGHQMVLVRPNNREGLPKVDPFYASRAPFQKIEWQSNAGRLQREGQRFGIVTEARVGDRLVHSLHGVATLNDLKALFGVDRVKDGFGGPQSIYNDDFTVGAFEFYLLLEIGMDRLRHPMVNVSYFQAQGMALAMGGDLMTDDQYQAVVRGPGGNLKLATPNGELVGPNGERYVHGSFDGNIKTGTDDVENRPEGPFGTRDYTGNVGKWMKKNDNLKQSEFGLFGGTWWDTDLRCFSKRNYSHPRGCNDNISFLVARSCPGL